MRFKQDLDLDKDSFHGYGPPPRLAVHHEGAADKEHAYGRFLFFRFFVLED
jgi:hypothetical protein